MKISLSDEELNLAKKRNRAKKLSPKVHQIVHESGRSTKAMWARIVEKAKR